MSSINIKHKPRIVYINLNNDFYPIDAVKKAIDDFGDVGDFSISNKKDTLVSLKLKSNEDIDKIGYEFCNYVLALMKNEDLI